MEKQHLLDQNLDLFGQYFWKKVLQNCLDRMQQSQTVFQQKHFNIL